MSRHFNRLTPREAERLAWLAEELGEAIQAIGKIQRHGYESVNPLLDPPNETNREALARELGHVQAATETCCENNDIEHSLVTSSAQLKRHSVAKWMHYRHRGIFQ